MRRLILFLLWIFIFLIPLGSFYVAYTAFVEEREGKVAENVVTFLTFFPERSVVPLPYPELTVIKVYKGAVTYMSANAVNPIDASKYEVRAKRVGASGAEVYLKRPTPEDFMLFLVANPVYGGALLFSFVLYAVFFFFAAREFELKASERLREFERVKTELLNRAKAARLVLATEKLLKDEARSKLKTLLDELTRRLENK
ncbi:MAG: hypothetical protein GXO03_04270 [Aquificae bacterium]|nr:hypothetical protein [Aquificota bacterium]